MAEPKFLDTSQGRRIAYHQSEGSQPGVIFLGGLRSDMEGTKAVHLEAWAKGAGRAFLRFDYSGHGSSSGVFEEGSIGEWAEDALAVIETLTEGPQVIVGSSMGGWVALLMARKIPHRIQGMVGIAAAPDFTEDGYWDSFSDAAKQTVMEFGQISLPSEYGDPMVITRKLIEDGRENLVLRDPLDLPFPARFLQGTADPDVSQDVALRLLEHVTGPDIRLGLVKDADHRFSTPECLDMIIRAVEEVT